MAATGKTPILLYGSTTATNTPTAGNLTNSSDGCEIAINVADKNLFFKDSTNAVNTVPIRQSSASSNGWLSSTDWSTFNSKAPAFTYTTGYIPFGQGTTTPTQDAALFWDNTNKRLGVGTASPQALLTASASTAPIIRLNNANTAVAQNEAFGTLQYYANDTSSGGVGIAGYVRVSSEDTFGLASYMTFGTRPQSPAGDAVEVGRFDSTGNLKVVLGNLVIGTSGKGIDFSATAGTGTSELLADYEEGTWTPSLKGSTTAGTPTYVTQKGAYRKVGTMVAVTGYVSISNKGGMVGNLIIDGLPYASFNVSGMYGGFSLGEYAGLTLGASQTIPTLESSPNSTVISVLNSGNVTGSVSQTISNTSDSTYIVFSGVYFSS